MLYITGNIGPTTFDNTPIQPATLIELFGLPNPKDGLVEFRQKNATRDAWNQLRVPPLSQFNTVFNATGITSKGESASFELRYAVSRQISGSGYRYSPTRISNFQGESLVFGPDDQNKMDAYVFYALHPSNSSSPFASANPLYTLFDREAEARRELERSKLVVELSREIFTMDADLLRMRCIGLQYRVPGGVNVTGFGFNQPDEQLRIEAVNLLNRDKFAFIHAWKDAAGLLRGMVQFALDSGVIVQTVGAANTARFAWDGGALIKECSRTEDPMTALVSTFAGDEALLNELQAAVNKSRSKSLPIVDSIRVPDSSEITLESWHKIPEEKLIEVALSKDVIYYSRDTNCVVLNEGENSEIAWENVKGIKPWTEGFAAALRSPQNTATKKKIVTIITGQDFPNADMIDHGDE